MLFPSFQIQGAQTKEVILATIGIFRRVTDFRENNICLGNVEFPIMSG